MYTITKTDEGFDVVIPVPDNEQFSGVNITAITMYVSEEAHGDSGELAVHWTAGDLENTGGGDMGTLLMRNWDDEVGGVMGEFYWNGGYTERLRELLVANGIPVAVAEKVDTSEWGMQDEERASYDAYDLSDWIREQVAIAA